LSLSVPKGWEVQVRPRSGLGLKNGITVINSPGSIDSNYRGEISAVLINHGTEPFIVSHGMKMAQIKVSIVPTVKLSVVDKLDATDRGTNGYGSTGTK
jgi:dUTP pyrophosphatase